MATPQLSPGVLVREVDLTVGRAENVLDNIGGIAGPFIKGPVDEPTEINTEQELISVFGKPQSQDAQYEYWMTASSFLSYGGVLKVVRTDDATLYNSNAGVGIANTTTLKVKNFDDYDSNYKTATNFTYAAKNPGRWSNGLKVCTIDNAADQRIGFTTTDVESFGGVIGYGVTTALAATVAGPGTTTTFNGYLKGIITGVSTDTVDGTNSYVEVKVVSQVSTAGTETKINYKQSDPSQSFASGETTWFVNNSGINTGGGGADGASITPTSAIDWYAQQTLGLTNSTVYWKAIAGKPLDSNFVNERNGRNDSIHVVIVDDTGAVTGIQGNILEKHLFLSKAKDATADGDAPTKTYYKDYIANNSEYTYAGYNPSQAADGYWGTTPLSDGFTYATGIKTESFTKAPSGWGLWGVDAQGVTFSSLGNNTYTFAGGEDYSTAGGYEATLGNLKTSYELFSNKDEIAVDYLLMGPGLSAEAESQAKANLLISLAGGRKDCMAVISPHRANIVNVTNTTTQTNNLLRYYSALSSSSYAVFDTGYKYTYDRFNNEFRYIPTNGDIAGLMVRTSFEAYPWFSPAGIQ